MLLMKFICSAHQQWNIRKDSIAASTWCAQRVVKSAEALLVDQIKLFARWRMHNVRKKSSSREQVGQCTREARAQTALHHTCKWLCQIYAAQLHISSALANCISSWPRELEKIHFGNEHNFHTKRVTLQPDLSSRGRYYRTSFIYGDFYASLSNQLSLTSSR